MSKKVLFLVNHDVVIYNFRKELVERLISEGYEVIVSSPYGPKIDKLVDMGCIYDEIDIERHGTNPLQDKNLYKHYKKTIKKYQPNVVLTYTIKPNIYGAMAAKKYSVPCIANITGLGTAFEHKGIMPKFLTLLYKFAFSKVHNVFFQNEEDMNFFKRRKIALGKHKLLPGSGVNVSQFSFEEYPTKNDKLSFLFIGRIMKDKGVEELFAAASNIKEKYPNIDFDAIGFCEEEYKERIETLKKEEIINFHGVKDNVQDYIKECNAVVHPTYHEGMSNVLLEASSMGRPILASNIPGCREIFDEGISGFGFKAKDSEDLTNTIEKFIKLPINKKESMGAAAREKVVNKFDREIVVNRYLDEIDKILNKGESK
ncbi:glycosyltransferase family 4 protein [Tetragenococcus koreensis]|uniref:glycosyltransferase family 4 protein n=1 Tax=Tetragenococcus koreensis TaxID=290335 RepID=UPI001F308A83|nr:glycosyltransferase family 4 protein [Tetragenococcus koreensis]MCF1627489.1 glycosyltransferase family 4 protein [Tetragenococcus koreensis]